MRFWITKNSELPIREQLVRQVVLGILSDELRPGQKLPSVRAIARRHQIHANTVSAAYHDLLQQGWLELRRGSGLYVRSAKEESHSGLDRMLAMLLESARSQGHEPEEVLRRLEHLVRPCAYERVLLVEHDRSMGEIVSAELAEQVGIQVEIVAPDALESAAPFTATLAVALPTRAAKIRGSLPPGVHCIQLRVRSVRVALEGQVKPPPNVVISIVSRSSEIRDWARALLIAVGVDPESLSEVDAAATGWRERLGAGAFVVTDAITVHKLPAGSIARVFRVVADSSIDELKQLCEIVTPPKSDTNQGPRA